MAMQGTCSSIFAVVCVRCSCQVLIQMSSLSLNAVLCAQELNWSLSPQTPISWLNVYMQVAYLKDTEELLIPRYPQATFTQIAKVRTSRLVEFLVMCHLPRCALYLDSGIVILP